MHNAQFTPLGMQCLLQLQNLVALCLNSNWLCLWWGKQTKEGYCKCFLYRYNHISRIRLIVFFQPIRRVPWQHRNKEHDSSLMKWHSFTKTILRYWKGKTFCRAFLLYISSSKEVYIIFNIYVYIYKVCICIHIYTYIYRWQKK